VAEGEWGRLLRRACDVTRIRTLLGAAARGVAMVSVLVAVPGLVTAVLAQEPAERPEQEVTLGLEFTGQRKLNLLLEGLAAGPGTTGSDTEKTRAVLQNDLALSDLFEIVAVRAGLSLDPPPDTTGWSAYVRSDGGISTAISDRGYPGARFVAGGRLRVAGSDLVFDAYLKEYPSCREILTRSYRVRPEWFREAAHRFADDIILYLTGLEGLSRTRIAFISDASGHKELYLIDFDGENARQITRDKSIALSPSWSSDGRRVAFVSFRRGDPDLYQVNLSTGEIGVISNRPGPDMAPSFSRDGRRLAYSVSVDGQSEIFVADADGKTPRRLTNNRAIDTSPSWSPTGNELAFTSDRSGNPQIYVMDADGANTRRLTFEGNWNDSPDWSPDGLRIVYVSREGGTFKIRAMLADGSGSVPLTTGGGSDENPKWSPDGRKIVFSSTRDGRRALYTMNSDGSGVRRLTFLDGDCYGTSWSTQPPR
jgi:TolB protein